MQLKEIRSVNLRFSEFLAFLVRLMGEEAEFEGPVVGSVHFIFGGRMPFGRSHLSCQ